MMLDLFLINIILVLIFNSGFVDEIDAMIQRRFKFHHLPKPFSCVLCMTWWSSLLYIIITGNFNLLGITLCLINATLTSITTPLTKTIENALKKIVWYLNKVVDF